MPVWITEYWIEWVFGVIAALLLGMYRSLAAKVKKQREANNAILNGVVAILQRDIMADCEDCIAQNLCPVTRKSAIWKMYQCYDVLQEDAVLKNLVNRTMDLPTSK